VATGREWGIENFEIRGMNSRRVPDISPSEEKAILAVVKEHGIKITAISPGLFKISLESGDLADHLAGRLTRSMELAHRLGTDKIIIFGFVKPAGTDSRRYPDQIVDLLGDAAGRAGAEGITLSLENEYVCWADTGETTAEIVSKVGAENLGINWDPGNAFIAGETAPYPEGYTRVKPYLNHLHIKDVIKNQENRYEFVNIGEGSIDWEGQVKRLMEDGFTGYYTVETHFGPLPETSRVFVETLKGMIAGPG